MGFSSFSIFQHRRRLIAGAALAVLLQSLAWGAGTAGSTDLLESQGARAVHEQGCLEDSSAPADQQEADNHCNEACHFWTQFQILFPADIAPALGASSVLCTSTPAYVFDNRSTPPFRPPRTSLPV